MVRRMCLGGNDRQTIFGISPSLGEIPPSDRMDILSVGMFVGNVFLWFECIQLRDNRLCVTENLTEGKRELA